MPCQAVSDSPANTFDRFSNIHAPATNLCGTGTWVHGLMALCVIALERKCDGSYPYDCLARLELPLTQFTSEKIEAWF